MTLSDTHVYASPVTDLSGRNAEIAALKARLEAGHGPGHFIARRVNADGQSDEFGDRIVWSWQT